MGERRVVWRWIPWSCNPEEAGRVQGGFLSLSLGELVA